MFLSVEDLRAPFRSIASNVAVITTLGPHGPHGCTGTAWAEDPRSPYVVTPLKRDGHTHDYVARSGRFAASLLAADQAHLARQFAKRGDRFSSVGYTVGALELPLIDGAVLALECRVESTLAFGTYDLFVGRVESVKHRAHIAALTYHDGTFGTHVPEERVDA